MTEKSAVIMVTGIGGNVGQGILRILRQRFPVLRLVGTDVGTVTAGHYFCDAFHQVPYSYDPAYGDAVVKICQAERVDLIIPATDYEVFYLGRMAERLPCLIAAPPETSWIFIDKYETHRHFTAAGIPFAESYLPSEYRGGLRDIIVKPREGRGSRGIHVNPPEPTLFDDTFLIQERVSGPEITTAFYVTRQRQLHGSITFERALASGMTERCQVTFDYDTALAPILQRIIERFDVRGPCNLQSIVTTEGRIVPFEVNCRYSGTNSIRSQLGFPDVVFGVQEYLLGQAPDAAEVMPGAAVRLFMDIIYPHQRLDAIEPGPARSFIF